MQGRDEVSGYCNGCGNTLCICDEIASDLTGLRSCDTTGDDGCCDEECWYCHAPLNPSALRTLAANLAVAGALCDAFDDGEMYGMRYMRSDREARQQWRPGCGRSAT